MNKNIIIGLLVVAALIVGGYLISRDRVAPVDNNVDVNVPAENTGNTNNEEGNITLPPTPQPGLPTAQTGSNVVPSSTAAVVSGNVKPNGSSTSYWFEYGETSSLGQKTASQNIGSGYSLLSASGFISGLKASTTYYYRLSAKNSFGTINGTTYNFQTNTTPAPTPALPTVSTKAASNIARTSANVNGQVDPNSFATSYWFEYGKDTNLGSVTSFESAGAGTAAVSASVALSGLEPLTKYFFRINAQNQFGTVNGTTLSFTTSGPASPAAPTADTTAASAVTKTSASLNGRINPGGLETTYWFEYSEDSLLGSLIGAGTTPQTLAAGNSTENVKANATALKQNTKYYYRLVARNSSGTVRGDIVSFTTNN